MSAESLEAQRVLACVPGKQAIKTHCHALPQIFLDNAESVTTIKPKRRQSLRAMEDLKSYLDNTTFDELAKEMKELGIAQTTFAESVSMNPRYLSAVKSPERRGHYFNELGAIKLACLWVIKNIKPATKRRGKAK